LNISVFGCGHIGLIIGSCLSTIGHKTICADLSEPKVNALNQGQLPFYEPHLIDVVNQGFRGNCLVFTTDVARAADASDAIFVCVDTHQLENGEIDLSAIESVARVIADNSRSLKFVVVAKTVPAKTGQQLARMLAVYAGKSGVKFRLAVNPPFLPKGAAVERFLHPDRILIGVEDKTSEQQLKNIYGPILEQRFRCPVHPGGCPSHEPPRFVVTTIESAELIKQASNCFLALKISYANVIADICESFGANVDDVLRAMGLDPRIRPEFLSPGLGFGGRRLLEDIRTVIRLAERAEIDSTILREVERINRERIDRFWEKACRELWTIRDKKVSVFGLAYKAGTDDVSFSPALELVRRLLAEGAHVRAYDPEAMENAQRVLPSVCYCSDPYAAASGADAVIIATDWNIFQGLDWERIREVVARPLVLDARNQLDPRRMMALGFEYRSFGRPG